MLKNKIKNLISLIENTEIDEIEVSSFWGGQKIRLSKNSKIKSSNKNSNIVLSNKSEKEVEEVVANDDIVESNLGVKYHGCSKINAIGNIIIVAQIKIDAVTFSFLLYFILRVINPPIT